MTANKLTRLSLVICTYNRASYVRRLLLSLDRQCAPFPDVEIIVVDNNSVDNTRATVEAFASGRPYITYVFESAQGLSHARNRGAQTARGEHLLYLDDDAITPEDFVSAMRDVVVKHDPDLFGGPIYPLYAARRPLWFPEKFEVRKKASVSGFHPQCSLSGGNFGIRKSTLIEIGGFDPRYGMAGRKVGMLEERIVVDRYKAGRSPSAVRIYYCLEGYIFHHTPMIRMTKEFQVKRIYLADYQLTRNILRSRIRNPGAYYRATFREVIEAAKILVHSLIAPSSDPEDRFDKVIKLTYSVARTHACLAHWLTPRAPQKALQSSDDKPLRLLWVKMPESGSSLRRFSREAKDHRVMSEAFAGLNLSVQVIDLTDGVDSPKRIYQEILAASPTGFDAILFEDELKRSTAQALRVHYPKVQVLVRVRRTALMSELDFGKQLRNWPRTIIARRGKLLEAFQHDRALVHLADKIICASPWEQNFYLRLFGGRKKFIYTPPALPADAMAMLTRSAKNPRRLLMVTDIKTSSYDDRASQRLLDVFSASGAAAMGWTMTQCGKIKPERDYPGVSFKKLTDKYFGLLSASAAVIHGGLHLSGQPSRFAEAIATGAKLVLPRGSKKRVDPDLRPYVVEYDRKRPHSLVKALAMLDSLPEPPLGLTERHRLNTFNVWRAVFDECRLFIQDWKPEPVSDAPNWTRTQEAA